MLKDIDNKLNMNAAFELLRKCDTAAEVRVYCAAEGVDADSLVQACLCSIANFFEVDPNIVCQDFTVEKLYKYRAAQLPSDTKKDAFKLGYTIVEDYSFNCIEYDMLKDAVEDYSFNCIEYDMLKDALANEFNLKLVPKDCSLI